MPAWDQVGVEVAGQTGAGSFAFVEADIDSLRIKCLSQESHGMFDKVPKRRPLFAWVVQQCGLCFAQRHE